MGPVLAPAIEKLPEAIARLVEGFDPLRIIVFGSYARGEARPDSDLDLLVAQVRHHDEQVEVAVGMRVATSVRAEDDDAQRVEPVDQALDGFRQLLDGRR